MGRNWRSKRRMDGAASTRKRGWGTGPGIAPFTTLIILGTGGIKGVGGGEIGNRRVSWGSPFPSTAPTVLRQGYWQSRMSAWPTMLASMTVAPPALWGGLRGCEGMRRRTGPYPGSLGRKTRLVLGRGGDQAVQNSVVLQLHYGATTYPLRVNIIEGDLPLLISRVDQGNMDGVTRSKKDLFCIPAQDGAETAVPLVVSESGHWLIPLV